MDEVKFKEKGLITRLTNKTFNFPPEIKEGFYTANYFLKATNIIAHKASDHEVTMQWFQRKDDVMLCGIDEAIALVHTFAIHPEELQIEALDDGDIIFANEPVLKITGKYQNFGFLESLIDGILARRSSVATNVHNVLKLVPAEKVFSMADRQDDYLTQVGDGYATYVAGITKVSTNAQGKWWNGVGIGTMPHALIQIFGGNILKAVDAYIKCYPSEPITALIDYHNNVVHDSIMLAKHLQKKGKELYAVRVDTSEALIDHYFDDKDTSNFNPHGVCKELIFALRKELDKEGFKKVKIIVSSGFNATKIAEWIKAKVPADVYGVGSYFTNNQTVGFTGDLVLLDGAPEAKEGRHNIFSSRLKKVTYPIY